MHEEDIWLRSNENSNSIGNLIQHLNGNITQYILSSLNGSKDQRDRKSEFEANNTNKEVLLESHDLIVKKAIDVIKGLDESALLKKRMVQGFKMNGLQIIIHVVEHYSYHTGQITYMVKQLKNKQLGYYKDVDLNAKNEIR